MHIRTEDALLQPQPATANPLVDRLRAGAGRRAVGICLALLIEGLLLLLLLTLGRAEQPGEKDGSLTVVNLPADEAAEEAAPEPRTREPEERMEERPEPQPPAPQELVPPQPVELKPALITPSILPAPLPPVESPPEPARPAPSNKAVYGPPDRRGPAARDTERVGTAPNGEPLYAAAWYREPRDDELGPYLSTAKGPGWGLIACRTAPDYRVEDCVGIDEYPRGSQITRAVLAAAWEFKVRPPRVGGRSLVGSWVRIRIDYGIKRR